ncbi:zinc finger, CCHC-type containing protein [Tanacetum coccineum]
MLKMCKKLVTLRRIVIVETRRITQVLVVRERGLRTNPKTKVDAIMWWIDSDATTHVCKDRFWFKTYEPVEDGSVLYMGDDHFCSWKRKCGVEFSSRKSITLFNVLYVPKLRFGYCNNGMFMLNLNKVPDDSGSVYMSSSTVSNLCDFHVTPSLGNKKYVIAFIDDASRAVVRLPDPKRKTLGEQGIDCIFVGYAEHSKAYSFYVIEPNDYISINSIIESRDAIFDENRFSSIPRPKDIIQNLDESQRGDHSNDVPSETPKPRRGKRARKAKSYGPDFQLYLVEGSRDQVGSQYSYSIDDEIGYIVENNTWVLSDLPPGCKPLGCKWIFKRKMKVDGTIDKFKARLVIQGFRQKEWIDYFDTYAPVVRINTIRLLLALTGVHNLVIHQMDIKTTFLNGDLDEEVYMKQPEDFVMPDCSPVSTPMDLVEKLKPNTGKPVDQLEYSRAIGCSDVCYKQSKLDMIIAYVVGRLRRFISQSGWVSCLGEEPLHGLLRSKHAHSLHMENTEFVALVEVRKEAEWRRNLIHEIPFGEIDSTQYLFDV